MSPDRVIAILVSDVHLRHRAPVARSAEPDWYAAMKRYLDQIAALKKVHKSAVVIYAGDVFDKWNSPPELINFAIEHLPVGYAVPGQHDLPCHNYQDKHKSAYHTLTEAGKLVDLVPGKAYRPLPELAIYPFPWGHEVKPLHAMGTPVVTLAVVHAYCWAGTSTGYPGADENKTVNAWMKRLVGYDCALFGDNHKGFVIPKMTGSSVFTTTVFNHGALMPVKSDERDYVPRVGLLSATGYVTLHPLDVSQDKWVDLTNFAGVAEATGADLDGLLDLFQSLGEAGADFGHAVLRFCKKNNVPKAVKTILEQTMEEVGE